MTRKSVSNSKNILIIEDETMLQEALITKMKSEGYTVRGCTNAKDAFKLIALLKPDLILTDLVMGKVDGFEILKMLQENFQYKKIPVIVVTNLMEEENGEQVKALGAKDYIVKSKTPLDEIVKRVKNVLA